MKSKGKLDKTINSFYHLPKSLLSLPLLYGRILHKDNRVAGWADLSFLQNGGDAYEKSF
jgi:hypothetical protein